VTCGGLASLGTALNLRAEGQRFCDELSDLLNGTICTGIRIVSVVTQHPHPRVVIGYRISPQDQITTGIPLIAGRGAPRLYMGLSMRLEADVEHRYLMVTSSVMILALDPELSKTLVHYDYEREKADGYPEAHIQICATSPEWETVGAICGGEKGRALERLHLPVGPRRFRPSVEDLIEFVVAERIVPAKQKAWRTVLNASRERFRVQQLRAAVRRDPATAIAVLHEEKLLD
jgi:hypothetical protein